MKNKLVIFVFSVCLLIASVNFVLTSFYSRYQTLSNQIEESRHYNESTANAVKHAVAASNIFNLLRRIVGEDLAEAAVIKMGVINEYIERLSYYKQEPDSAREIMKDLHNNYVGIMAAKLADHSDAFPVILAFADNRTLIVDEVYNPFYEDKGPDKHVIEYSYEWFKEHHNEIENRVERKIMRAKDLRSLAQVRLSNLSIKSAHLE